MSASRFNGEDLFGSYGQVPKRRIAATSVLVPKAEVETFFNQLYLTAQMRFSLST